MKPIHIVFIIQLPKIAGGCQHFVGFQGGKWQSAHIDELLESNEQLPQIEELINHSVSDLFKPENRERDGEIQAMEIDQRPDDFQEMDVDTNPEPRVEVFKIKNVCNNTVYIKAIRQWHLYNKFRPQYSLLIQKNWHVQYGRIYDEILSHSTIYYKDFVTKTFLMF